MKWWNDKLNRYHAEFFLLCVEGLGKYKTTVYTKELFSKVIKSIGEILVKELQKEVSRHKDDESLNKLLTLITQIGEKHENNTIKENREESKEERNENNDNQSKENSNENEELKESEEEKESEKEENEESENEKDEESENEKDEEENEESKISFIFPKSEHIFKYLNIFGKESVANKFCDHIIQLQNNQNENEPQEQEDDSKIMNGF